MNRSNSLQKIIVSVLTVIICCGIYTGGAYLGNAGFSTGITADVLLVVFCVYYSLSVCVLLRKKPLKTPGMPVKKLFRLCLSSAVFIYIYLAASVFFIGTAYRKAETVQLLFLVLCVYSLCRMTYTATIRLEATSDTTGLDPDLYPELYSAAKKAAKAVGYDGDDIQISVTGGVAVSAIVIDGSLRLLIGSQMASIVNEFELEALMTAEIGLIRAGSVSVDAGIKKKFTHWQLAVSDGQTKLPNFLLALQYRLIESRLISELDAASVTDNAARVQAAVCFGIPSDYLNALAKLTLFGLYIKYPPKKGYFDDTKPPHDMDERLFAGYIAFRDRYANRLDSVIRSTSDAGFDTPLSEKIPLLSENGSYDLFTEPISRSYAAEAENLLKIGNDLVSEALSAGYDEARETQYLPAKRITDDYEAKISEGRKPELFEMLRAAEAYAETGETDDAERLYDLILSENPNESCACLEKGKLLLQRYDSEGVRYINLAVKDNCFCAGRAFTALSEYYGIIGDVKNSEFCSEKAAEYENSESARNDIIFSAGGDGSFLPPSPEREALSEICEKLKELSDGYAEKIVIAAREYGGEVYNIVFVKPQQSVTDNTKREFMHGLFLFLDSRDENFYLVDSASVPELFGSAEKSEKSVIITFR